MRLNAALENRMRVEAIGREQYCCLRSGATYAYLRDNLKLKSDILKTSLSDAISDITSGRNDAIYLSPDSHTLTAVLTWAKNCSKLIGLAPEQMMNQRSRIGHNCVASPLMTVSGYGNEFRNLYTMHGYGTGADYIGWLINGARNAFHNVHFGGPMQATQAGHASYEGVAIDGSENYFKRCVFGTDTIARDEITPNVTLGHDTLTIFEDCLFIANLADTDPIFVKVENTEGYTWAWFKNCQFMAMSSNYAVSMAVAFAFSATTKNAAMVLDPSTQFQNVTALCAADVDHNIWLPQVMSTTSDIAGQLNIGLAI